MPCASHCPGPTQSRPMLGHRRMLSRLAAAASLLPVLQLSRSTRAASATPSTTLETNQEAFQLAQWILDGGGQCNCVQIAFEEKTGQTLITTEAVQRGRLLISLPKSRQLMAESADPLLQSLIDKVPSDLWASKLALPLIAERVKGSQSSFLPYLSSLPAGISGLPIFFRPEEIKQLQYPPLLQQINLRCRWLLKFASEDLAAEDTRNQAFAGVAIDANLLGWGMGCASSRAFKVADASQPSLLPLIDLCNHSFTPNCKLESSADGAARLVACQDIAAQEPLNVNYGELSNTTLLQDYGFIVPDNPFDKVQMMLSADQIQVAQTLGGVGIPKEPEAWQENLLAELGASGKGCSVDLCRSSPMFDWRLVAAVRILCAASKKDLQQRDLMQLGDLDVPLAIHIERKAMQTLATMCAQLVAALGTKLNDDKRLLREEQGTSPNSRLAVEYRVQLKTFIQAALALVLSKVKRLQTVAKGF